jgi:hypothetical protein
MRIHGIHVQGLRSPQGRHELAFEPGYNVVVFPGDGQALGLSRLLAALLYPDVTLADPAVWDALGGGDRARAGLALSFGPDAYRLIADFEQRRVALARYDARKQDYDRVANDLDEIGRLLRAAGLPRYDVFQDFHQCGESDAAAAPIRRDDPDDDGATAPMIQAVPVSAPTRAPEPPAEDDLPTVPVVEPPDPQRLKELRALRDRVAALDRDCDAARAAVAERGALGEVLEGLDEHLEGYRNAAMQREGAMAQVEEQRRVLLDERNQLQTVPENQRAGLVMSVGLAFAGGIVATVASTLLLTALSALLGVLGVGIAVFTLLSPRLAQRKVGNVEAKLSSLRVKERTIERRFESQTAEITGLLKALKLATIDDLEQAVEDYRRANARVGELETKRTRARATFTPELANELRALEEQAERAAAAKPRTKVVEARPPDVPASARMVRVVKEVPVEPVAPPPAPVQIARAAPSPNLLMKLGEASTRRPAGEVRSLLATSLPIYLKALTDGRWTEGRRLDDGTWGVRGTERGSLRSVDELPAGDLPRVSLAFRLALLEVLSPALRVPLIAGPSLALPGSDPSLARALRRVARAVQVIQVVVEDGPWVEQAEAVQRQSA